MLSITCERINSSPTIPNKDTQKNSRRTGYLLGLIPNNGTYSRVLLALQTISCSFHVAFRLGSFDFGFAGCVFLFSGLNTGLGTSFVADV
jgi:hypothetical protein